MEEQISIGVSGDAPAKIPARPLVGSWGLGLDARLVGSPEQLRTTSAALRVARVATSQRVEAA
ncbi:MAG TPA: hypothetical protein VMI54_31075 [Polyangiaceae bacterium]|nr:hypothetical protein [Polyangiaceae bacterium]